MKNPADAYLAPAMSGRLSRSQWALTTALALVLLPTCLGLVYLLADFWASNQSTSREATASVARDTLLLTGYDQAVRLSFIAQEAYVTPSRRDSLHREFDKTVRSIHAIGTSYVNVLSDVPAKEKERLLVSFVGLWSIFDELVEKSEKVFTRVPSSAVARGQNNRSASTSQTDSYLPEPSLFFRMMREQLDRAMRAELQQNLMEVQRSRAEAEVTTYRGFFVAFFLFGLGSTLAIVMIRRGRQSEERKRRYETLLEASLNPIEVVDVHGKILYVNPAFDQWAGSSLSRLLGHPLFEGMTVLNQAGDAEVLWARVSEVLSGGEAWSGEIALPRGDGAMNYTLLIISPIVDEDGRLLEAVGIHHDVTERRELALEIR